MRTAAVVARCVLVACTGVVLVCAPCAFANELSFSPRPWLRVGSGARPSVLAPGSEGEIVVTAENLGDAATVIEHASGPATPVRISDVLPAGLEATGIAGVQPKPSGTQTETVALSCSPDLKVLSCESTVPLVPYDQLEVRIGVRVRASAVVCEPGSSACERNEASVTGGEAPATSVSRPVAISAGPVPFGVEEYGLTPEEEGGALDTQAGSHSFQVTGTIALDQGPDTAGSLSGPPLVGPAVPARRIVARLPVGLVADPSTVARCPEWQFLLSDGEGLSSECLEQAAVGVASVTAQAPGSAGTFTVAAPIFNVEPQGGEPARFGFFVPFANAPVLLNTSVRSGPGEDWGVNLSTGELPENAGLISARLTFWGAPYALGHKESRGWGCLEFERGRTGISYEPCLSLSDETHPPALVRLPTSCTGAWQSSVQASSWTAGSEQGTFAPSEPLAALTGCEQVPFSPTISTEPTTHSAASPSGLAFDLRFDTEGLTMAGQLAQSDLRDTVVTFPEGMTIDPSAGVGLGACTQAQYAAMTLSSQAGTGCPEASKLGTVEIQTPLLFTTVYGSLFLAQPYENPFPEQGHPGGSLLAVYVVARSRADRGILVKLAGKVTPDPVTGRLTVSFHDDPQLPFGSFNFHFHEGQQAPLITPATCGTYTTQAQLTPFSQPETFLNDTASFDITSGSEGGPCPTGPLPPFSPRIQSISLNSDAGLFSPLSIELTRTDAMSEIATYSTDLPPGLTANLTGVPFCPEADVELARQKTGVAEESEPSCPPASLIGHTLVGTGVGSVLDYVPGALYLSGPTSRQGPNHPGDPFSVVSVTSATIGPFDLGTVVVRFGLSIDPYTAQVRVDPTGSEPIPTIIDGIVTHVRDIRVSIDKTGFTLNPTSCAVLPVSSTMTSNDGQAATVSAPFQATHCEELPFTPKFKVSTSAHTSRANGASLTAKLTMPAALGGQSNIRQVKVDLPKQLPSRLETLKLACPDSVFTANPASCPKGSFIGYVKADTPILPVPLMGPMIFVSHGGEEFPSLVMVLQGYGVTVDIVGSTFINQAGITSTTFKTVPDEPVGSFELTLPQGRYSALAATVNLCTATHTILVKRKITVKIKGRRREVARKVKKAVRGLLMPTLFVAQNGTVIHQSTPIAVTGCGKAKKTKHGVRRRASAKRGRGLH
jgi:hypothetical protein